MKRAFVVTVLRQKQTSPHQCQIGYRSQLWGADNEAEAIGEMMLSLREAEPDASFSQPAAVEITPDALAAVGVCFDAKEP